MAPPCMRRLAPFAVALLGASGALCAGDSDTVFRDGFDPPGFEVRTPDFVVAPGATENWCYSFQASNPDALAIRRFASTMAPAIRRLTLFTSEQANQPPGSLTQGSCAGVIGGFPEWNYVAHDSPGELVMPADDGGGTPLAVEFAPQQLGFLEMYVVNDGTQPATVSADLTADVLAAGSAYTRTATYVTVNIDLLIPPGAVGYSVEQTCPTPEGAKFWWLSTRTNRFATFAEVRDADVPLVVTTDWEHPEVATFPPPDFHEFASGGLTYHCVYGNPTGAPIGFGDDPVTDETCMAIGFFFPADDGAKFCLNDTGPL